MTGQDRLVAGRYRLGEQVGVGAMGIVWRARDERLRRTVAVKQLLLQPGLNEQQADEARQRAMREARIAARLQHPNVVIVYDVAEDDGQPWLIMEYVPSRSLAMVMRDSGPLAPYEVALLGARAASGLAAAHDVGVVHRDVKPGNVLLGDDGSVKIADFGISRAIDDVVVTATGLVTGTPAYLAPEMAKGETPAPSSDVFALGSTLYAAVQGTPPFGLNDNPLALLHAVANGRVSPPSRGGPLTPVLMRLLREDPDARPTMREAHAELAAVAAQRTLHTREPVVDPSAAWTRPVVPVIRPAAGQPAASAEAASPGSTVGLAADRPATGSPAPGSPPPGSPSPGSPPVRRRTARLVLVLVVALLVVGVAVVVVDRAGRGGAHQASGSVGRSTTTATAGPTTSATPDGSPSFAAMTALVQRYYGLLPGDVADAWQLLSVVYRSRVTFAEFREFYGGIAEVTPDQFHQTGPNTVTAVVNFVTRKGVVTHEPYRFTIVNRRGTLIIDNAVQIDRSTDNDTSN